MGCEGMCIDHDAIHLRMTCCYCWLHFNCFPTNMANSLDQAAHFQLLLRALSSFKHFFYAILKMHCVTRGIESERERDKEKKKKKLYKNNEQHAQNREIKFSHCQRKSQSSLVHVSFLLESFRKACLTLFLKRFETMHKVSMFRYSCISNIQESAHQRTAKEKGNERTIEIQWKRDTELHLPYLFSFILLLKSVFLLFRFVIFRFRIFASMQCEVSECADSSFFLALFFLPIADIFGWFICNKAYAFQQQQQLKLTYNIIPLIFVCTITLCASALFFSISRYLY